VRYIKNDKLCTFISVVSVQLCLDTWEQSVRRCVINVYDINYTGVTNVVECRLVR